MKPEFKSALTTVKLTIQAWPKRPKRCRWEAKWKTKSWLYLLAFLPVWPRSRTAARERKTTKNLFKSTATAPKNTNNNSTHTSLLHCGLTHRSDERGGGDTNTTEIPQIQLMVLSACIWPNTTLQHHLNPHKRAAHHHLFNLQCTVFVYFLVPKVSFDIHGQVQV